MQCKHTPNNYRVDGDVAYIELRSRQGAVIAEAMIDAEDLCRVLNAARWYAHWDNASQSFYVRAKNGTMHLHRFVLDVPDEFMVDHKEHNTLDCRKRMLRPCTRSQNGLNRKGPQQGNRSGHRNVYWDPVRCMWRVDVRVKGKKHFIGRFDELTDAADAATSARKLLHEEFAS